MAVIDQNGGGFYINAGDLTIPNNTYTWTFCVPDTNCYQFTISDVFGDGICCNWGNGSKCDICINNCCKWW